MILVTGATGHAGAEVVRALLERGQPVRAFVRDPIKAEGLFGDSAELAPGDFAKPDTLRAALDGVETLFLSGADDPRRVAWEMDAIDMAAATGVRRIVKLSSIVAQPGAPVAFWSWHGQIEQHLRASGVATTILRANAFMSNVLAGADQVAHEGRLFAPAGEARIAMIDPRDVGAAAAAVLTSPGHDGKTHVLTGPEAITYERAAAELAAATGREVEFIHVPDEGAKQAMTEGGLPEFVAEQIVQVFVMLRQGVGRQVTPTVEELTGSPARDFASFAHDHAHLFAPAAVGAGR